MIPNFLFASAFNSVIDETPVVFFLLLHGPVYGSECDAQKGKV